MRNRNPSPLRLMVLLALSVGVGLSAAAQSTLSAKQPLDLITVYRLAVEQDPRLRAAEDRRRAVEQLEPQARALFLPEINLEAEGGRTREQVERGGMGDLEATYNQWSAGVALTQPLFRMESFPLRAQARIQQDQASLQLAQARQDLLLRVSAAYFDVLLAQDTVATVDAELAAIETELRRARRALEVGTGTITDVNEAQARYDLVQANRLRARNQLEIARERLRRLIGQPVGELAGLREDFVAQTPSPSDPNVWAERAERYNLEVQLAERAFEQSREQIRQQRAGHYPRVDLVARYGRNYQSSSIGLDAAPSTGLGGRIEGEQATIGLRVQMPLFAGGGTVARVREAQANRDASFQDTLDAKREAALQAEAAFLNLVTNLEQIRALEQALRSIRSTEESTQRGLEVGVRTTLDVLNVQRERFETERQLAEARYNYLLNYLQLQAAVGGGTDESSIEDVNFFLASEHAPLGE